MRYSVKYALLFSVISAALILLIVPSSSGKGWNSVCIYYGIITFILTYLISYFLVEKAKNFKNTRLIFIAIIMVPLSHWLFWYGFLIVNYFKEILFNYQSYLITTTKPINGIIGAGVYSIVGLLFIGWIQIPISIALSILLKKGEKK